MRHLIIKRGKQFAIWSLLALVLVLGLQNGTNVLLCFEMMEGSASIAVEQPSGNNHCHHAEDAKTSKKAVPGQGHCQNCFHISMSFDTQSPDLSVVKDLIVESGFVSFPVSTPLFLDASEEIAPYRLAHPPPWRDPDFKVIKTAVILI